MDQGNVIPRSQVEKVFEADEMQLRSISPEWTAEEMLGMEGIFYLKDVVSKLTVSSADCKKRASDIENDGESPWKVMGIRKAWTHWIVRMKKFAEYIDTNSMPKIRQVDLNWDANQLLGQKGQFYLTDVCEKIPFSAHQIRYQARQNKRTSREYGVWKDPGYKTYVVEMESFAKWIRSIWQETFSD